MKTPEPVQHGAGLEIDTAGLIAFTQELVRARSVHDPAAGLTESPAADLVAAKMAEFGWTPQLQEIAPGRTNVLAFVDGADAAGHAGDGNDAAHGARADRAGGGAGKTGPTIAFVGHTDVVTEGQLSDWTVDPYGGEIRDGKLYGRGSADMKSGLAAALYAVRALQLAGPFPGRIAICAVVDEEGLMLGSKHLAASGLLAGVAGAIICEPEGGEICTMAKGAIRLRIDLHGIMAHGAMPQLGHNPIPVAGHLITELSKLQAEMRAENDMADGVDAMSITPTVLRGGDTEQLNVIPSRAILCLDIRTTPAIDHDLLLARIAELAGRVTAPGAISAELTVIDDRPAVEIPAEHPVVTALSAAHQQVHGAVAPFGIVPGTTDGTILTRDAGLPTVVYGPGGKWIAHQADEFVELAELDQYALVYAVAAATFLNGACQGDADE